MLVKKLCNLNWVLMSILTGRELEFLLSLRTSWKRLYCNELARLLREDDSRCDARHEVHCIAPAIRTLHSDLAGQILAFGPISQMRQRPKDLT